MRDVWQAILRFTGSFDGGSFTKQINKRCFAVSGTFDKLKSIQRNGLPLFVSVLNPQRMLGEGAGLCELEGGVSFHTPSLSSLTLLSGSCVVGITKTLLDHMTGATVPTSQSQLYGFTVDHLSPCCLDSILCLSQVILHSVFFYLLLY